MFGHCVISLDCFQSRWARLAGFELGADEPFRRRHRLGRHSQLAEDGKVKGRAILLELEAEV